MNSNIRNRLLIIVVLVAASVWALWPRTVTVSERTRTGQFHDTTLKSVPPKKGLDLQGGMNTAHEDTTTKRAVTRKREARHRGPKARANHVG